MRKFQLSPEYLAVLQQFSGVEPQAYASPNNAPQRRPLPAYAKQQQALQQAYYNYRKPAVVPPRPRPQLHPQALAQAEVTAQAQAHAEAQNRAAALQSARGPSGASTYQLESYASPKLGTFEQELLQLVSANQAQEFNLIPTQPKSAYPQQQYVKPTAVPAPVPQLPEQYHIETSPPPRYQPQQRVAATYQSVEQPVQIQYQTADYSTKGVQPFRPSPQYDYVDDSPQLKGHQAQAEAEANARAQAQAEAQALAFQKIAQASYQKHREAALEQIRVDHERYKQQSALEQIQQGTQVSDAGRAHIEDQHPKDPEAAYRAKLKAQAVAEAAEARRLQTAAEYKAHTDAIRQVEAQQHAQIQAQEKAHYDALNFERNQMRAQAQAQALAQAQAEALYKAYQQSRAKANNEIVAAARAQAEAKKVDPDGTPVIQYLLPNTPKLPAPNNYFTNDDVNKYQTAGSTYAPRSVAKPESDAATQEQARVQSAINQPRQVHKLKIPPTQSSVYVSQSGLLKKSPVKSLTIEEIVDQDQLNSPQIVRIPSPKDQQVLTQEELSVLINAGYSVTPVPPTVKPTQRTYLPENTSVAYYLKKQRPVARPEYVTYEEIVQRSGRPVRKNIPVVKQDDADASEKVTYLVPLEPSFGTRQPPLRRNE